jgi:thiol-disulfide isomerase/thioredoxin
MMHRSFLIFAVAFIALMAGVLFYAARFPVSQQTPPAASRSGGAPASTAALEGAVTVAFALADMEGRTRDFSEWDGSHRILNFWATWCAPCRREIPLLKAFQDEHAANGLQVIGIAVDFPEPVVEYAKAAEFNYPILVGEQDAMAVAETSGVEFIGLPFTMFVARDGELIGTHMGEIHAEQLDRVADVLADLDRGGIDRDRVRAILNSL